MEITIQSKIGTQIYMKKKDVSISFYKSYQFPPFSVKVATVQNSKDKIRKQKTKTITAEKLDNLDNNFCFIDF